MTHMTPARQRRQRPIHEAPRVVIAGAGFGGLAAMRALARRGMQVTLIDRNVYATFQPLLYQVATAGLAGSDVAYPARGLARRHDAVFLRGELAGIDPAARQVTLADGTMLGYDYLIVATGVAAAYHGVPGAAEHTLGLYTRRDAIALRDRIMAGLDEVTRADNRGEVAVTVIGGGATGVELAGTLADLRAVTVPALFPEMSAARIRIRLIHRDPELLGPFHPVLRDYTHRQLTARGVEVRAGARISAITPGKVTLADGAVLPSDITVWAAGVAAPEAVSRWGLPQGPGGRLRTGPDLRVVGQDRIFAVGDIAVIDGQPLPQLAQPALQMGRHAAAQVRRLAAGRLTAPFGYRDKGIMATIGYRSAVVQLPSPVRIPSTVRIRGTVRIGGTVRVRGTVRIRGTVAWLAWLGLHLITLLGGRNRVSALVSLSWRYLTWRRGGGLIIGDQAISDRIIGDQASDDQPPAGARGRPR